MEFAQVKVNDIITSCCSLSYRDEEKLKRISLSKFFEEWIETSKNENNIVSPVHFTDTLYGLASVMALSCSRCMEYATRDARKRNGTIVLESTKRAMGKHKTNSDLCKYDINIRFCLALQSMGIGGEQAHILTSFLDLPEAHKWPRNFSVLEKFLHPATTSVKDKSQEIATKEEISLAHTTNSNIPQTLLEEEIPRFRVEASFDMGWQVRSSRGKYGSSTGHGLLIGALSKKVMDSVV
jgi:hypothetical protein